MVDFKKLKSNNIDRIAAEINKINNPVDRESDDIRFWQPQVDKVGNGFAIIRFLPAPPVDGDDGLPWVRLFKHGFQGPTGSWYIENSLTTLGLSDPVSEFNTVLWNSGVESDKDIARKQKRKLQYISNIYIVDDPSNPENNGKVFLYRYGKKIFDKISEAMDPKFKDETKINPFDLWKGANFKLKIRNVEDYRNYDKSEFEASTPLSDNDEDMERIWKSEYSLLEFIAADKFKTYDVLKAKVNRVLGIDKKIEEVKQAALEEDDDTSSPSEVEEDDEELNYFKNLAS